MDSRILKFGIIGCGLISHWHARAINEISSAKLLGVADINEENSKAFALKYNIFAYSSVEQMLCDPEIDVVCICTPSGLHAPLAVQAAQHGKHIIVEKPMALNLNETDEIIRACQKNNITLTVISQLRFSKAMMKLKEIIQKDILGKLITGDIYMKFYRSQEYYDKGKWRGTWEMDGGGAVMNQGIHGIDLLQYVMGPVHSIFSFSKTLARKIEVEDTAVAALEFKNGALGTITATTSVYPGFSRRLEVCGTKGSVILEEDSIVYYNVEDEEYRDFVKIQNSSCGAANDPGAIGIQGHIAQISDMVNAILNNRKPLIDVYEGRKSIEIIRAIYQSAQNKKLITFPLNDHLQ